jgi:hypothetical protein
MRAYGKVVLSTLVAGFLVLAPIYLAALLLLKALKSLIDLVQPIARVLPAWLPAEQILALLLILILCFLTGVGIRTRIGQALGERIMAARRAAEVRPAEIPEATVPEDPGLTLRRAGTARTAAHRILSSERPIATSTARMTLAYSNPPARMPPTFPVNRLQCVNILSSALWTECSSTSPAI